MPNPKLNPGERTLKHTVKIPESTSLHLKRLAVQDRRKVGTLIRDAIELYLASRGAETLDRQQMTDNLDKPQS